MNNLGDMNLGGNDFDNLQFRRVREEDYDSGSEQFHEAAFVEELNNGGSSSRSAKRKKYHRHTAYQIHELENAFKDNPHPDEKARMDLGRKLGLETKQVKFWFQNRRTQMKTQLERHENTVLKQENDKLRMENLAMKEALRSPMCQHCGGPAILGEVPVEHHHLMIENARLKDELNRLGILADKFLMTNNNDSGSIPIPDSKLDVDVAGKEAVGGGLNPMDPSLSSGLDFGHNGSGAVPPVQSTGLIDASYDKSLFVELGFVAVDELVKLAQPDNPLWFKSNVAGKGDSLVLDEYEKVFPPCIGMKPSHYVTDATRATGTIIISSAALVETLMDENQWTEMFPWIIGKASTLAVISPGTGGNKNGLLLLMQAEFQILSSSVPSRQMTFIRLCKQYGDDMWAIVDVSVDTLFHGIRGHVPANCRRLPSGCVVRDLPNGCSKVTWIEHIEFDESIVHQLFRPLVRSGLAFGAHKWIANLQKQCELFTTILSPGGDHPVFPPSGKKSIVTLAQRMTRSFCMGVCATVHKWEVVQNADNTRLTMRQSSGVESGEPAGIILSATTTIWMCASPQHLLSFLQNEKTREHWDVLSQDGPMHQVLRIPKSQDPGNNISLLRANVPGSGPNQRSMLILQDTYSDAYGSMMVHAAVDGAGMNAVMIGGDSSTVAILPSGFAIMPDCISDSDRGEGGGSLLTIGFQILVSNLPAAKITMESVDTVKSLLSRTIQGIKDGLQ